MSGHIILVLGMHRSGTSLIAKSLECLGAELGPRADWKGPDNPVSFNEDQDVLTINQNILHYFHSAWDDSQPTEVGILPTHVCRMLEDFVHLRFADFPLWAVKEPRFCRLLPVWRRAFENVGCKVSVVHAVRHPMAVAKSLQKRNGFSLEKGLALWAEYVKRAREDADPSWPSITAMYESMMLLPTTQIDRMSEALSLPIDEARVPFFTQHYVNDRIWHHVVTDNEGLPLEVNLLWQKVHEEAMR